MVWQLATIERGEDTQRHTDQDADNQAGKPKQEGGRNTFSDNLNRRPSFEEEGATKIQPNDPPSTTLRIAQAAAAAPVGVLEERDERANRRR